MVAVGYTLAALGIIGKVGADYSDGVPGGLGGMFLRHFAFIDPASGQFSLSMQTSQQTYRILALAAGIDLFRRAMKIRIRHPVPGLAY